MNTSDEAKAALRKAATVIQSLEKRIAQSEQARTEPIAIVGTGLRLPGGVHDLAAFGALLRAGTDTVRDVPRDRFDIDEIYDADPAAPGKTYTRTAAFLDRIDAFDAAYFGLSPREAAWLDPQHRLVLECAWEALDDAGIPTDSLRDSQVGTYIGIGPSDYTDRLANPPETFEAYTATGLGQCFSSGRVSFLLGLRGPSLAIDTACSSSLVALHLACQALRQGDCEVALAGGVLLMAAPAPFLLLSKLRALAPDGRSKPFSAAADGYGRGEGCGVIVLKRLSHALRDGDRVLALVRGSAINHDGPASGLVAPNGTAQRDVIRQALASGNLAPADVDYVEAHGTGTPLGDPVELEGLAAAYGVGRARKLLVGSVKSNIGHLEWASGIAGVLKVVAALRERVIPRSLHAEELNPTVDWQSLPIEVVREDREWASGERIRRAGISSYGMSGTNAHVILEEYSDRAPNPTTRETVSGNIVTLSAKSASALDAVVARFRAHVVAHPELSLADLAFSTATTRAHHAYRLAIPAATRESLLDDTGAIRGDGRAHRGKLAFLFTGQGAQRPGMGKALHAAYPAFAAAFDRCCALFDPSLRETMWGDGDRLDRTAFTQPALFAFEYALAALWQSWGIEPDLVGGHSIGEIVAACVANVFSLEDAATLVAARARLMDALPAGGAMVAIAGPHAEVARLAASRGVAIAGINAPESVVISGAESAVLALAEELASRGMRTTRLRVSHAFHSERMEPMLADFERVAASITYRAPDRPIVSNVTGALAAAGELTTPAYWVRHVRGTVRFADDVRALAAAGATAFVEIGPRATLLSLVSATLADEQPALIPSVRADRGEVESILSALGAWYVRGGAVSWREVSAPGARRVQLPAYPYERERHWVELAPRGEAQIGAAGRWPLSGREVREPGDAWHHVIPVAAKRPVFVQDHVVFDRVVIAGAFHVGAALAVAAEHWPDRAIELTDVEFVRAKSFDGAEDVELHAIFTPDVGEARRFEIVSASAAGPWTTHVRGRAAPIHTKPRALVASSTPENEVALPEMFAKLDAMRIHWGARWRWVTEARYDATGSTATLAPTYAGANDLAPLHPSLIDNAFAVSLLDSLLTPGDGTPRLPFAVDRLRWYAPVRGPVRAICVPQQGIDIADFVLVDESGAVVCEVEGQACRGAPLAKLLPDAVRADAQVPARPGSVEALDDAFLEHEWIAQPVPAPTVARGRYWLAGGSTGGFASALADALVTAEHRATLADSLPAAIDALGGDPTTIVHLGSLDAREAFGVAGIEAALAVGCDAVLALVQAIAKRAWAAPPRLVLVTRGAQALANEVSLAQSPLLGLGRVIAVEHAELRCARIDLDPQRPGTELAALVAELVTDEDEPEIALRGTGDRSVARIFRRLPERAAERTEAAGDRAYRLELDEPGVLDRLALRAIDRRAPADGEIEIAVEAAGLNFVAVLLALGAMPREAPGVGGTEGPLAPGGDCVGRIVALGDGVTDLRIGDRVAALVSRGAFGTHATLPATLALPVPANWSAAEAAALPVAYLTAWYSLDRVAHLRRGERVLIHAATGGVGVAAVQWAQHVGAQIFATAGTPEKRAQLRAAGIAHVSDSRSLQFADDIRAWTNGEGVDVVLNSLSGDGIEASFDLLRSHGRFVELGKRDYYANGALHLRPFLRNLSFALVDLLAMMAERPAWVRELYGELLAHVRAGVFTPPPVTTFPIGKSADAFRTMAAGKHVGKLVVTVPDANARVAIRAGRDVPVRADGAYLVTGGLGGLGLGVAEWLAARGAGHVVLVGRSGVTTDAQRAAIAAIEARGARVTVSRGDIGVRRDAERAVADAGDSLRGVIHAAGLVDDGLLAQQTPAKFRGVMAPKVWGALHLHELTRKLPLDFFVMYSSGAGLVGSPGQGNYAAANAFLDALAHHRRRHDLPALSIDWGPFADVGMAATHDNRAARLAAGGMHSLSPAAGLAALERLLRADRTQTGVIPLDARKWREASPVSAASKLLSPLFAEVAEAASAPAESGIRAQLIAAAPAERAQLVRTIVRAQVAHVLRIPEAKLGEDPAFAALGMDSLIGLELRNRLGAAVQLQLPATLIFQHPTIGAVAELVLDHVQRLALAFAAPVDSAEEEEGTL